MDASIAARNALAYVLGASTGERILILCDEDRAEIGSAFAQGALSLGLWTKFAVLPTPPRGVFRKEPDDRIKELITSNDIDIYVNLLRGESAETPFRIQVIHLQTRMKKRLGHCPGVTMDMLTSGALALTDKEYVRMQGFADKLMATLADTESVHITCPAGTDLTFAVRDREFFTDTYVDWKTLKWMNLPVGEVIVGPIENSLNGTMVSRGAVGGIGRIKNNVTVTAKKGKAVNINHNNKSVLSQIKTALATDRWSSFVGEFAFGINPHASLVNEFLEIEKIQGTVHLAFGNNMDYPGGKNNAKNHMDFLMLKPSVDVTLDSGKEKSIMKKGKFNI
jgi:leucyl aminopeptidase (aminopeptidase T)